MRQKTFFNESGRLRFSTFLNFLLSLPKLIRLFWRLLRDPRVPVWPKIIFVLSLVYTISPFDLLPDFLIPFFGYTDDVLLVVASGRYLIRNTPPEITEEHLREIEGK